MRRFDRKTVNYAFVQSVPVLCGYLFLGSAFGIMLQQAGYNAIWAFFCSLFVYAGTGQMLLVSFLKDGTPLLMVCLMTLLLNCRHMFYGLTFIEKFRSMGKRSHYMIFSLTDETYSVFCGLPESESDGVMLHIALYDQLYWIAGSVIGAALAQGLPFDLTGIDFSMTALFVVICVEKALEAKNRVPMILGGCCALAMLFLLGQSAFLAPALALTALLLTVIDIRKGAKAA
mgnify:CR=1 FL=1